MLELGGAATGLWSAPGHSEHDLTVTRTTIRVLDSPALARPVVSAQKRLGAWQQAILQTIPQQLGAVPVSYLAAAGNRMQTSLLRLALLSSLAPLAAVIILLAVIEALLMREIRRLRGGREHGFIFHRLHSARTLALWLPFFLFLLSPSTPPPELLPLLVVPAGIYVWGHMVLFKRDV